MYVGISLKEQFVVQVTFLLLVVLEWNLRPRGASILETRYLQRELKKGME